MTLRITKASDPITVSQLVVCVYAPPGTGKSSLAFTADKPLLLDFDKGAYRSGFRKDTVQPTAWADVAGITGDDLAPYSTLVLDTAGRALDMLAADIIAANPKMGRGGALTLQGFGELKARFSAYLKLVRSFGKDVVLIAHSDEKVQGDDLIERLDAQGASKNEIYKCADLMGRLSVKQGKRFLSFDPTEAAFGKNPAGFPVLTVPNFATEPLFLAGIIKQTKDAFNSLSAEQQAVAKELADWQAACDEAADADGLTDLIEQIDENASEAVADNAKRVLLKAAKAKGFTFDKAAHKFIPAPQAA
jgi:hypothetical protein